MTDDRDLPQHIKDSAMVLAVVLNELGFGGDKLPDTIDRGNKLMDAAATHNITDALGDDLDAYSVAVGFAAALGAYASCMGIADGVAEQMRKTDVPELIKQMRKAKDN